ncbi:MAG: hypothetical protein AAGG02_05825 [Cyanobacteria bacterium P01_H01_bin.15]
MTMQSRSPVFWAIGFLGIFKFILHQVSYQIFAIILFPSFMSTPYALDIADYIAAFNCIFCGNLQHGLEAQRYLWKRSNLGKLYSGGLFGRARLINHTGHTLRDASALLFAPANLCFWLLQLPFPFMRLLKVMNEGVIHLRQKYGKDHEDYQRKAPCLLIPGIY